jgi:pimeloyl-ACP methyl ester carboxylesterase
MNVSTDGAALVLDAGALGLERREIETALGGVVVHIRTGVAGAGSPLILLHGAAGSWSTWTPLIAEWDRRGDMVGRALVLVDLPGWGGSAFPDDEDAYTIEALGDAVLDAADAVLGETVLGETVFGDAVLNDAVLIDAARGAHSSRSRYRLVGHSLGGFVALHLAAAAPERVSRVDLVSAVSFAVIDSGAHPVRAFRRLPGFTGLLQGMRFLSILPGRGGPLVRFLTRLGLLPLLVSPLFDRRRPVHPSVVAALGEELRPRAFGAGTRRAARYPAAERWQRITCPVHLVSGDRDVFVARDDPAALARTVPTLRRTRLARTGHFERMATRAAG